MCRRAGQILNIAADEDGASALHAPDTSGTNASTNQGMATQADDSSVTTVPSSAGGFGPSPSSGVILYGGGSDSSFVDSMPRSRSMPAIDEMPAVIRSLYDKISEVSKINYS